MAKTKNTPKKSHGTEHKGKIFIDRSQDEPECEALARKIEADAQVGRNSQSSTTRIDDLKRTRDEEGRDDALDASSPKDDD